MLITTLSSPGRTMSHWIRILGNSIPLMNWSHPDNGMKRPVASLGCCLSPTLSQSPGLSWAWHIACPFPLSASFLMLLAQSCPASLLDLVLPLVWLSLLAQHPPLPAPLNWLQLCYFSMLSMPSRPPTAFRCFLGYTHSHQENPGSSPWLSVAWWISAFEHRHPI